MNAKWRGKGPVTFFENDLPNMATHRNQVECGFSLYAGVLVQWDEDHDLRVLTLLDQMPRAARERLLIVQEHEGSVSFVWKNGVPAGYNVRDYVEAEGDTWNIHRSVVVAGCL